MITLVQEYFWRDDTTGTTGSADLPVNVTPGNCVLVLASWNTDVNLTAPVYDGGALNAVQCGTRWKNAAGSFDFWAFYNHPGGQKTFSVPFPSSNYRFLMMAEFSGVALAAAYQGDTNYSDYNINCQSGAVTPAPSIDGTLIVVAAQCSYANPTYTNGAASIASHDGHDWAYYVQPTAGAVNLTGDQSQAGWFWWRAISLKPAAIPTSDGFARIRSA